MEELPTHLKHEFILVMHKDTIQQVSFFEDKDDFFQAFTAPLMKSILLPRDQMIYSHG